MGATDTFLIVGVEGISVALLTLVAGISDEVGTWVIIIMAGFWLIWLITNSGTVSRISNTFANISK